MSENWTRLIFCGVNDDGGDDDDEAIMFMRFDRVGCSIVLSWLLFIWVVLLQVAELWQSQAS